MSRFSSFVLLAALLGVVPAVLVGAQPATASGPSFAGAVYPVTSASSTAQPADGDWPLQPRPAVVNGFDPPSVSWSRGHRGVDLAGRVGQPVRAAVAGVVTFASRIAGVGIVVVGHGATRTTYQPVDPAVRRGDHVPAGGRLGHLEWHGTHCSPAACLHWGLLEGERYLDPLALLDVPRPVRLLPASGAGLGRAAPALTLAGVLAGRPAAAAPW